jgi:hypothetical protein
LGRGTRLAFKTMRLARDLILVICAVISTACLVYIAIHLDTAPAADEEVPRAESQLQGEMEGPARGGVRLARHFIRER